MLERFVLKTCAEYTSRHVKRTSGAGVMLIRTIDLIKSIFWGVRVPYVATPYLLRLIALKIST